MMAFLIVPSFTEARIVSISASDDQHSAAINDDGTVWAWGRNSFGQLGDGMPETAEHNSPTPV